MVLLKRAPPKEKSFLVIGTTSVVGFLESLGLVDSFSGTYHVPKLRQVHVKKVLKHLNVFAEEDIDAAGEAVNDMPIKKIYMLVEMAAVRSHSGSTKAIFGGEAKININRFFDILGDDVSFRV